MSRFRVPHTLVLLFGMIVLAYTLTWVLPQGQFETVENEQGRQQVVPGTYDTLDTPERLSPCRFSVSSMASDKTIN